MNYDKPTLAAMVERLSAHQRLALALLCAERMLPQFARFEEAIGGGTRHSGLRAGLDRLWDHLCGMPLAPKQAKTLLKEMDVLVPDGDAEPYHPLLPYAEDAAAAVYFAAQSVVENPVGATTDACHRGLSCVYDYVKDLIAHHYGHDTREAHKAALAHPILVAEDERQSRDADELRSISESDQAALIRLRKRAAIESEHLFEIMS